MPGSGQARQNLVRCAMPTPPGPHLGRGRGGQDRPGRAAVGDRSAVAGPKVRAGTGPRRPGSAARDAPTGIAATPVTISRSCRVGGARRSARPARRRPRRGSRGRRSPWRGLAAAVGVAGVGAGHGIPEVPLDPGQDGMPSVRTRRVQRIRVAILPGRSWCGTFALMVTRRVAISALECDARHVVRSWRDRRDAARWHGGRRG